MVNTSSTLILAVAVLGTASVLATPINGAEHARDLSDMGQIEARATIPTVGAGDVLSRGFEEELEARQVGQVVEEAVDVAKKVAPVAKKVLSPTMLGLKKAASRFMTAKKTRDLEDVVVERSEVEDILSRAFEEELEARQVGKVVEEAVDVAKKVAPVAKKVLSPSMLALKKAATAFMTAKKTRDLEDVVVERSEIEDILSRAFEEELEARQIANVVEGAVDVAKKVAPVVKSVSPVLSKAIKAIKAAARAKAATAIKMQNPRDMEDLIVERSEIEDILSRAFEEELEARQVANVVGEAVDVAKKVAPVAKKIISPTLAAAIRMGKMALTHAKKTRDLEDVVVERSDIEDILSRAFEEELEARQIADIVEGAVDVAKKVAPVAKKLSPTLAAFKKLGTAAATAIKMKNARDLEGGILERSEIEDISSRAFEEELEARQIANVVEGAVDVAKTVAPVAKKIVSPALAAAIRIGTKALKAAKKTRDLEDGIFERSESEDILSRAFEEELEARQIANVVEGAVDVAKTVAPVAKKILSPTLAAALRMIPKLGKKTRDLEDGILERSEAEAILSGLVARDSYPSIDALD